MKPSYPSRAWFEDGDNFRDWCMRLNLKFVAQAAHLVLGSDDTGPVPLTDALDQTIAQTVEALTSEGVPDAITAAFREQYGSSHYDKLLNSVCALAVEIAPAMHRVAERKAKRIIKGNTTGSRASGTNPRAMGTNPKALGTSSRQLGISPRQLGISPRQLVERAKKS